MAPSRKNGKSTVAQQVKSILESRLEMKQFMFDQVSTAASSTGTVFNLSQFIVQGDTVTTRDGSQIFLESARLILTTVLPSLGIAGALRVILVQDTQAHGAAPTVDEILQTTTLDSAPDIIGDLGKRFRWLYDNTLCLTAGGVQEDHIDITRSIKRKLTYHADTAVAAANGKNSLHLVLITDLVANPPTFIFKCLMKFHDA